MTADLERDGDSDSRPATPIRGAIAANRGERSEAPGWICAHLVG
jgi:hypothetical protein